MDKPRILHIHTEMAGGGVESFIQSMSQNLVTMFDFSLFSLLSATVYDGLHILREENVASVTIYERLRCLIAHIRKWSPQIVHMHFGDTVLYGTVACALAGYRVGRIVHWHSGVPRKARTPFGYWLRVYCLHKADRILACSRAVASSNAQQYRIDMQKVTVVYNPVDVSSIEKAKPDVTVKRKFGITEDEIVVVYLGRLSVHIKGLDILAEAIRRLPKRLPITLLLVGPGDIKEVEQEFQHCDRAVVVGPYGAEEVPALLKACDVYVQPSRYEGLGLSILEAMAAGLPVVATNVGGIPEVVQDGVTGLLVPAEDPAALAQALERMVADVETRRRMGQAGQQTVRKFDIQHISRTLAEIYRHCLKPDRGSVIAT